MKKFLFSALICFLLSVPVFAQPICDETDPDYAGAGQCGEPDNPAPIDRGVIILLGLTSLYAVQKLRFSSKKELHNNNRATV